MAGLETKEEIIGKKDSDLYWKDYAEKIREVDLKVMQTKKQLIMEETIIKANGEKFIAISYKGPLLNKHDLAIGIVGVAIDIHELKETQEKLEEALAEIKILANSEREKILKRHEQFMDNQAHDIRTPVGGIISGTQVLPTIINNSPSDAAEWVAEIHRAATQILDY